MPIEIANLFYLFDFFFAILVIIREFLFHSIRFRRFRSCSRIFWNINSDINRNAKEFFLTDINNFSFFFDSDYSTWRNEGWMAMTRRVKRHFFFLFFLFFFFTVDKTGFRVDWYTRSRLIFHASQCFVAWWSLTPRHFYYPAYNRQIFRVNSFRFFLYFFLFF